MPNLVNVSTQCQCIYGTKPVTLTALDTTILAEDKPALNIKDIPKVDTFMNCNSPTNPAAVAAKAANATAPCTPAFLPPIWVPGSPDVIIRNSPALTNDCRTTCALGSIGCVSIITPGAPTVQT